MATDETKTRVIEAAGKMFADKGFRDATVRDICDAAGVGLASVNYHFGDKQRLYVHVVQHAYECLQNSHSQRLADVPEMPPDQRLAEWILRITRKIVRKREETWQERLCQQEILNPTPACEEFLRQRIQSDLKPVFDVLHEVMPPDTTDAERWFVIHGILGQVLFHDTHRAFIRLMTGGGDGWGELGTERVAEHVTRFSLAALGLSQPIAHRDVEARS
ncbi:MAG: TetR/AcrR family transcriptional regulator [Phycisphaerae bacterium]|nr:TetR/AcrR family transcriptional regulator [Phycisphaerae bacterium]